MGNVSGPERPDPWQMRASDADREVYVSHLQTAFAEGRLSHEEYDERLTQAYQATTYADLYPLLIDLPVDIADLPVPPLTTSQQLERVGSREVVSRRSVTVDDSPAVAVLSETRRGGRWVVPAKQFSTAVMGQVTLDLQEALLDAGSVEIRAVAVMGEVSITIPDDIRVEVVGAGVLGEFTQIDDRASYERGRETPPGAPVVKVSGAAVLGSVNVHIVSAAPPQGVGSEDLAPPRLTAPTTTALPTPPSSPENPSSAPGESPDVAQASSDAVRQVSPTTGNPPGDGDSLTPPALPDLPEPPQLLEPEPPTPEQPPKAPPGAP